MNLSKLYRPITATPFRNNNSYTEIPPCEALSPYVCCYWGTTEINTTIKSDVLKRDLIIPDTCMDIIININYTENSINNLFCGIQDIPFTSLYENKKAENSTFAIRFFPWAVILFADDNMRGILNTTTDTTFYFGTLKKELEERIQQIHNIQKRIEIAEQLLMKRMNKNRENTTVMNAIYEIVHSKGNATIKQICDYACISNRQLERLFKENIGMSPKKFEDLVRYQILWKDIIYNKTYNIQDAVYRYGFSDQAHLINTFKKYHTMTPSEARQYAKDNF